MESVKASGEKKINIDGIGLMRETSTTFFLFCFIRNCTARETQVKKVPGVTKPENLISSNFSI